MGRTTYIRKICTADIVKHWGAALVPLTGRFHYAVCNAKGRIKWASTRLVTADQAIEKEYKLVKL